MTTASEREAALRRALLSAAEYIEPAPGGLERIQQRLGRPRPLLVARLEAAWTVVLMRAPDAIEAIRRRAAEMLRLVWDRFGPKSVPGRGSRPLSWLRPLAAMSVAVFVIGAGVYVGLASPASLFKANSPGSGPLGVGGTDQSGRAQSGPGTPDGNGSRPAYSATAHASGATRSCPPSLTPYNPGQPSSGPTIQSGSPTPTLSGSTSTSPSPSPSTSSDPSDTTAPTSANSAGVPEAGLNNGNPASLGTNAATGTGGGSTTAHSGQDSVGGASASQSATPSSGTTGTGQPPTHSQKYNPCQTTKHKSRHHKKTSTARLTSMQLAPTKLTRTQPGRTVPANLD